MSNYGDQMHCENVDYVFQLEIGQAAYLLTPPRIISLCSN